MDAETNSKHALVVDNMAHKLQRGSAAFGPRGVLIKRLVCSMQVKNNEFSEGGLTI